jgi:M6 family metalloprotease-like protein
MLTGRGILAFLACLFFCLVFIISPVHQPAAIADTGPAQPLAGDNKTAVTNLRIIVILAEFPDALHKVNRDVIEKRVFTDVSAYYKEVSYGLVTIAGDVMPDWIMMPKSLKSYGEYVSIYKEESSELVSDIINRADESIDFSQYNRVVVIVPEIASNFALDFKIPTQDGVSLNWVTVQNEDASTGVIAHELAHTFGLHDLYNVYRALIRGSSDYGSISLGPWCLMSTGAGQHLCGFNKVVLGWIPAERIVEVSAGSRKWVSLEPLENSTNGIQIIKINRKAQDVRYQYSYNIEARRRTGFDDILPDEGILISSITELKASRTESRTIYAPDSSIYLISPVPPADDLLERRYTSLVYDRYPLPNTLAHATFDLGSDKKNIFKDNKQNLAIIIVNDEREAYDIIVTTLDDADKIADYAMQLHAVKQKMNTVGSDNCSPEAKDLLALAASECKACIKNIRSESPVLDIEKLNKVGELTDRASVCNNKFKEVQEQLVKANSAIENAEKSGRYIGLGQSKIQLKKARELLDSFGYDKALISTVRARKSAEAAEPLLTGMVNWIKNLFKGDESYGARFDVLSIVVDPAQALVGQPVVVTARVINYGDAPGIFQAELIANGKRVTWSKEQINDGAIATLPMTYMPVNGKFDIDFAGMQQTIVIKRIANEQVELKYDNDR